MDKPEQAPEQDDGKTPFERLTEFARRIIRVSKEEVEPTDKRPTGR